MTRDRSRHTGPFSVILILLVAASAWGAEDPSADPEPTVAPDAEIEAMTLRLLGMEGKLKESAHARKSADQARMEAERRLAEGSQEIERLNGEVQRLREALLELEQTLSERDRQLSELDASRLSLTTAHEALERRFDALRARVPRQDGGTLDADQARQAARDAYEKLRETLRIPESKRDATAEQAITAFEKLLHRNQLALARVLDAQGAYRIRPSDSLALISSRCYGDSSQWRALFEANRHVLEDPNQLMPGVTLVVP
ncbi:LysM peptidoglycan-binding domain-containing protein [Thiocapsa bogorovii]|uniref:LysM peptidoglycan-binding domain-containing protein n=1 Tax=Thiocapsa bogorovii TaxID=521689 RepID=UPI001E28531B|nr:LysM peptidoglycan-binding domain-containing protein [Thiocapsa bogorovii]UHD14837.1 LysM peptidoglycan-binding domain-containing protein [Thiocapsa bogorovii]